MKKQLIFSCLLGGVVLIILNFVVNGIFGFKSNMDMKQIPNEQQVYEILKENIIEPGRYICNPELTSEKCFPDGEPVFSVLFSGIGHESAGGIMLFKLFLFFLAPIIGSCMLSQTSEKVLSSYPRKVFFFIGIGLLFAAFGNLANFGIGDYPLNDALIFGLYNIIVWTVVGMVVAWRMKPSSWICWRKKLLSTKWLLVPSLI